METLLRILFWCPRCWQQVGIWLFNFCGVMLLISWRLAGRVERVQRKTGAVVDLDQILSSVPLPIPTTAEGFALTVLGMVTGVCLALLGKWARKQVG